MSTVTLMWVGDLNQDKKMQGASLKVSDEKFRPKVIELKEGQKEIRIGRLNSTNPPNYMIESCINKRMISRNHASIERLFNGGFMLYDHSMNGTYINYMRVSGGVTLKHGDIVCFGHLNGANLKPGEDVAPFFSDLKYQVHLNNPIKESESGKQPRKISQSGSIGSPRGDVSGVDQNKILSAKKQGHKSKRPPVAEDNNVSDVDIHDDGDDDDDLLSNGKRKPSNTSRPPSVPPSKKSNGERTNKKHPSHTHPSSPPLKKSKLSSSTSSSVHHSSKDKKPRSSTKRTSKGSELDSGGELFHYDTEECSARPCKQPQDNSIDWIQCDKCSKWYHQVCLGLRASEANVDVYYCPYCKK